MLSLTAADVNNVIIKNLTISITPMILYIHGFNSSSQSGKAQELKRWLEAQGRGNEWLCPDLPTQPQAAIQLLQALIADLPTPPKLLGSSLGGFYATYLVATLKLKAVLINPVVHPHLLLRPTLNTLQQSWHSADTYIFTQTHLDELSELDILKPLYAEQMLVMLETGDEVLNWQDAAYFYRDAHQLVFRGGDHGFTHFRDVLELIDKF